MIGKTVMDMNTRNELFYKYRTAEEVAFFRKFHANYVLVGDVVPCKNIRELDSRLVRGYEYYYVPGTGFMTEMDFAMFKLKLRANIPDTDDKLLLHGKATGSMDAFNWNALNSRFEKTAITLDTSQAGVTIAGVGNFHYDEFYDKMLQQKKDLN